LERLLNFLEQFQLVIYPSLIGLYVVGYNLYKKFREKHNELVAKDKAKEIKNKQDKYTAWEHAASLEIIVRIKNMCNLYRDKSSADRVSYVQIENVSNQSSNMGNIFISCLAEDDRYGKLPKDIRRLQRIAYSHLAEWVDKLKVIHEEGNDDVLEITSNDDLLRIVNFIYTIPIGSQLAVSVYDNHHIFIGVCIFEYAKADFNNAESSEERRHLKDFKAAVEAVLYNYHMMREDQRAQYSITSDSDTSKS